MTNKALKTIFAFTACILLLAAGVFSFGRADNAIDFNRKGAITIKLPLMGIKMKLYRIADWAPNNDFVARSPFDEYPVDVSKTGWRNLADTLTAYVRRDNIEPIMVQTSALKQQYVRFKNLDCALYLIISDPMEVKDNLFIIQSFIVSIPTFDTASDGLFYDVVADPKSKQRYSFDDVELSVSKVWAGNGIPLNEVEVQLLCNDDVYDTVTLNAENGWYYCWENLDGRKYWSVVEKTISGDYVVSLDDDEGEITITNTFKDIIITESPGPPNTSLITPGITDVPVIPGVTDFHVTPGITDYTVTPKPTDSPKLPQTGQLWWPVPMLAAGGMLLIVIGVAFKKR